VTKIKQTIFSGSIKKLIITFLIPIGLLMISPAQAAKPGTGGGSAFCPCFTSTIIDAEIAEGGGSGIRGLLDGTDGGFSCEDNGDTVNLRFNNADHSVSISVFGELTSGSQGPGCGWSGRPLDTTTQEASECQDQIKQSWAWKVLACPNQ
jgi:hypothetical protein